MEIFQKSKMVRLRSHHEKFLLADDDEKTVIQDRNGNCRNAAWNVEVVDMAAVRLKSCHGKYLTASNMPFLLGMKGKKVLQTLPKRLDSSLEWEPIREGNRVKLKTRYGQFLRANGGIPPWRNAITHNVPLRTSTQDWILWDLDILQFVSQNPEDETPPPDLSPFTSHENENEEEIESAPQVSDLHDPSAETHRSEGRMIYYNVADEVGNAMDEEKSFHFKGQTLEELQERLKEETEMDEISVNSRNPLNGKLYPLRLNLPPNNATMHIVIVKPSASHDEED